MFLVPLAALVSLIVGLPNVYRATATLLIEEQQVPESFVRSTVTGEIESRLQTMGQEVLNSSRLADLVDRLGLGRDSESREQAVRELRQGINVEPKIASAPSRRGGAVSITLDVAYDGRVPETAAQVANTLASFFIEENFKLRDRIATGTTAFLKMQLEQAKVELDEQERRMSDFRAQHFAELPQQMQANLITLERLEGALRSIMDNQSRITERRRGLIRDLATIPESEGGAESTPDADARRLFQLRQQLSELQARFTDRYPDVLQLQTEIKELEKKVARTPATPVRSGERTSPTASSPQAVSVRRTIADLESELSALKTEEQRIRSAMASYQSRVDTTPRVEQEFQKISRDYQATQELYQSLTKRLNDSQLSENMEQAQKGETFRLLSPAGVPSSPVKPNRPRLLAMALVASLALAAFTVVVVEYLDTSFHTADDLRQFTPLPILAVIPRIVTASDSRQRQFALRLGVLATGLLVVLTAAAAYFVAHDNHALLALLSK